MKKKGQDMRKERASSETNNEATGLVTEPPLDQETITLLAYFYWEARGCPHDSPHEDWFRAEAELRNRLLAAVPADTGSLEADGEMATYPSEIATRSAGQTL
jgi:hypothetical protein